MHRFLAFLVPRKTCSRFARACECVSMRVNPPCPPLVRYRRVPPPGRTADTVRSIERVGVSVRECVRACVRVLVLLALGP
jgi:hypothetical protein